MDEDEIMDPADRPKPPAPFDPNDFEIRQDPEELDGFYFPEEDGWR